MKYRQSTLFIQGFTLLEMLVVLVIIGMLAGLVGPRLFGNIESAKVKTTETQIKMLKNAIGTLYLDLGRYPSNEEGLAILSTPPKEEQFKTLWKGPYLAEALPLDPWNHAYQYHLPGAQGHPFSLYSLGADGQPGGEELNADIGDLPPR